MTDSTYSFNIPTWLRDIVELYKDEDRNQFLGCVIEKPSGDAIIRMGLYLEMRIEAQFITDRQVRAVELGIRAFVSAHKVDEYTIGLDREGENSVTFWGTDDYARYCGHHLAEKHKCTAVLMRLHKADKSVEVVAEWHKAPESLIQSASKAIIYQGGRH